MKIIKIMRPNLVDEVTAQMTRLIRSGSWKEGEKITSENALAKEFNVSRVVVREALQSLRAQNMVVTKQGLGSFVSNPNNFMYSVENGVMAISEQDFLCLSELRKVIETRAMDIVARTADNGGLELVEQALGRMEANQNNAAEYTAADLDYHTAIVQASGSRILIGAMAGIREEIYYILHEMNKVRDTAQYGVDTHRKILSHLKNHDAESAKALLRVSYDYNQARYSRLFTQT